MTAADLLAEIEAFLKTPGVEMSESTFGRLAVNDGKLVGRLRNGKGLTLATAEKVRAFISNHGKPAEETVSAPRSEAAA